MVSHAICNGFTELSEKAEEARVNAQRAISSCINKDYFVAEYLRHATNRDFISNASKLLSELYGLRVVGVFSDTGEIFYREENTPDEDAYNAALTDFNVSIYPAITEVFNAFDAAQIAFKGILYNINHKNYKASTFLNACENFNKACAALKNLHKQAEHDITIAIRISRILRYDIYARADAAAKAYLMCKRVSTHFKNAYAALKASKTTSYAYYAAHYAAFFATRAAANLASQTLKKKTAAELPTDFAAIWETLTTIVN